MSRLQEFPYSFDFYQALRLLECARPDLPRIGFSQRLAEDAVRFGQEPSLAFPPSSISGFKPATADAPARLFVAFLGLLGANGPLPHHITEYARDRERNYADPTIARFFDIFNHRAVSLFYRAWASCNKSVNFERGAATGAGGGDRFSVYTASLFGMGQETLLGRDEVPDIARLFYSSRLVCQTRHAEGLGDLLEDYFGIRCRIDQFVGQWMDLPPDCLCKLGRSRRTGLLGQTVIVGSRMWECQQKFRIKLGSMPLRDYQRMLPGGASLKRLSAWVRSYIGLELAWDLQLILTKEEVPQICLGRAGKLGWSTWLKTRPFVRDADDLVLSPRAA